MSKKNDVLFSIIVPVYNVEKYIKKSLESILNAIDVDCEVIIINDGSTDDCENIIKKFIDELPDKFKDNFKYFYKENKGLADTKNYGLELAKGKYISVVDSDDCISDDFYILARKYIAQNYDLIIYDLYLDYESDSKKNCVARAFKENIDGTFLDKLMMGAMLGSSCNKIIKKDLYRYQFPVGKQYEDVCVTPFIMIDANKIKYISNPYYIYLQREKSIVSSNTLDGAFYKICSNLSCVFSNIDSFDKYKEIIYVFFIDRTIDMLDLSLKNDRRNFLEKIKKFYDDNRIVIEYVINSQLIETKKSLFTDKQYKVLSIIYNHLYNKNFKKVKRILVFRRIGKWVREILISIKRFFKIVFGGIYG